MTLSAFTLSLLALLAVPGPTNTLLALAGAGRGALKNARLLVAALTGYLCAVLPLAWLGRPLIAAWPLAGTLLQVVAACWVLLLAARLWSPVDRPAESRSITALQVWLTTVLNPKVLVIALALLPPAGEAAFWPRVGLLALLVPAAGGTWLLAGGSARRAATERPRMVAVQRLASIWLAVLSFGLLARAFSA